MSIYSANGIQHFIQKLKIKHPEKILRKEIAISVTKDMRYENVSDSVISLRTHIKEEVAKFVKLAEETYLKKRLRPTP
jgi:DNA polymerase III psi subunit